MQSNKCLLLRVNNGQVLCRKTAVLKSTGTGTVEKWYRGTSTVVPRNTTSNI